MTEPVQYTLSSMPPMGAILGLPNAGTLVVGLEEHGNALRVFVGARWKGIYLEVLGQSDQDMFRRAWGSGAQHIWLSPSPPPELLHIEERKVLGEPE